MINFHKHTFIFLQQDKKYSNATLFFHLPLLVLSNGHTCTHHSIDMTKEFCIMEQNSDSGLRFGQCPTKQSAIQMMNGINVSSKIPTENFASRNKTVTVYYGS